MYKPFCSKVKNHLENNGKHKKADKHKIGDQASVDVQAQGNGDPSDEVHHIINLKNFTIILFLDQTSYMHVETLFSYTNLLCSKVKYQLGKDGKEKKTDEDRIAYQASGDSPAVQTQRNGDRCDEVHFCYKKHLELFCC